MGSNNRSQVDRGAAPAFRLHIRESLGEVPSVTEEVLCVVLAFSIEMVRGFGQDDGAVLPGSFAVGESILHANLRYMRTLGEDVAFCHCEASLPGAHLDAVIRDSQPNSKAEGLRKPIRCRARIGVVKHRNHSAWRNRTIEAHRDLAEKILRDQSSRRYSLNPETLSLVEHSDNLVGFGFNLLAVCADRPFEFCAITVEICFDMFNKRHRATAAVHVVPLV